MFCQVNGRRIYYEVHGTGDEALILLHHGLGSVRSWDAQVEALAGAGFRTLLYDRWGYGASDPRPGLSIPGFADDIEDLGALYDRLKIERAILVGHSDGGVIALEFALRRPEKVSGLVVVAVHAYVEPKMETGIRDIRAAYFGKESFRRGMERAHGEKADDVFHNWYEGWVRPENLAWDLRPRLVGIACPTLVVQGLDDEHATPEHAEEVARRIPNAQLWLLPGAGHMLPHENAPVFNRILVSFLQPETPAAME